MLDKIFFKQTRLRPNYVLFELVLIYDSRPEFTLSSDNFEDLISLLNWFLLPIELGDKFNSMSDYNQALESSQEITQKIDLNNLTKVA